MCHRGGATAVPAITVAILLLAVPAAAGPSSAGGAAGASSLVSDAGPVERVRNGSRGALSPPRPVAGVAAAGSRGAAPGALAQELHPNRCAQPAAALG